MNTFKTHTLIFLTAMLCVVGGHSKAEAFTVGHQTVVSSAAVSGYYLTTTGGGTPIGLSNIFVSVNHDVASIYFDPVVTVGTPIYFNYSYIGTPPFYNAAGDSWNSPYGKWCNDGSTYAAGNCGISATNGTSWSAVPGWLALPGYINTLWFDPSMWMSLNYALRILTVDVYPKISSVYLTSSDPSIISCSNMTCTALKTGTATVTANIPALDARVKITQDLGGGFQWDDAKLPTNFLPATSASFTFGVNTAANQAPTALINTPIADPSTITQGSPLQFTGSGTDPEGSPLMYEWTYGLCGGPLLSSSQSFDLSTVPGFPTGTTIVYLRVKDNQGAWSTNCPSRTITVNPPAPDLTVTTATITGIRTVGQTLTLSGIIQNIGAVIASGSFNNYFQIATMSSGSSNIVMNNSAGNLAVNNTQTVSSLWTPTVADTYLVTLCADQPPSPDGSIVESNEGNNCRAVTGLINIAATAPVCTIANAVSWTACVSSATCAAPPATQTVTGTRVGLCADSSTVIDNTCLATITCTSSTSICPNTVCETGETPISCPRDCKVKFKQF